MRLTSGYGERCVSMSDDDSLQHIRAHEIAGTAVAIAAIVFLYIAALTGVLGWNEAAFNASLIGVALLFPMIEHDRVGGGWISIYFGMALVMSVATGGIMMFQMGLGTTEAMLNPATLNFMFGSLIALAYHSMQTDRSAVGRIGWAVIILVLFMGMVYHIPWENVPGGPIQSAGMWAQDQLEPAAQFTRSAGEAAVGCVTSPNQCGEYMAELGTGFLDFLQTLPIWPALEAILQVVSGYAGGVSCMMQQGPIMDPGSAYDPSNPEDTDSPVNTEECFEEGVFVDALGSGDSDSDGSESDDSTGGDGGGLTLDRLEVKESEAVLGFNKDIDDSTVDILDFTVMGMSRGSSVSVSGSTITLAVEGDPGEGDPIAVTIRSEIAATDGSTADVDPENDDVVTCRDGYADGETSSC